MLKQVLVKQTIFVLVTICYDKYSHGSHFFDFDHGTYNSGTEVKYNKSWTTDNKVWSVVFVYRDEM